MNGIHMGRSGLRGVIDRFLASHLELILPIPGKKLYRQFEQATLDVAATQRAVLLEILGYSAETVIGREHGFAGIEGYADYAAKVPVRDYEAHRPYVNRHAAGEEGVLFPGKPLMYNRSSGTTAEPKLLPVTPYAFERTIKNRGKLWLYGLMRHYPGMFAGKDLVLVSPAEEGITEDGTPFGSLSGLVYTHIPDFMKLVHSAPSAVIEIEDYEAKVYTTMRFAIASDVTCVFTGNPATVVNLVTMADSRRDDIIRDIREGTLKADLPIPEKIRAECEAMLSPAPALADRLQAMVEAHGALRPREYWPNLRLLHTWTNGNCALVVPKLEPWFGDVPVLDFGFIASEITATDLIDPATGGSILQVRNAFYEFKREEQIDDPEAPFLLAHELEVGGRYYIYVTTFGGLYRYDMNDVIDVVGHFHQAPIVRFLYKGKGVTSLQGEKLSEAQLMQAVARASKETGLKHDFYVAWANAPEARYDLYIEFVPPIGKEDQARFSAAVDAALHEVNVEWEAKRHSKRLDPPNIIPLREKAFLGYCRLRLAEGALAGQLKWLHLTQQESTRALLEKLAF
ncbi:MAG: GH3 auxin-responsive promoter family protein [Pseudomonadota bacterium]